MNKALNILLSILLSVSLFLTIIYITMFNMNYIKFELRIHSYYDTILNNIESSSNEKIDKNTLIKDVNEYVDSYFKKYKDDTTYNRNVAFLNKYNNMRLYHDIVGLSTIGIIVITGILFIKTKKIHNIKFIIYLTSIIGILLSFVIYLNINYNEIINMLLKDYYYIYLGINIILLLIQPFIYISNKIVKKQ